MILEVSPVIELTLTSVSYTHLDVYKRQGLGEDIAGAIAKKEDISGSQKKALEDHMTTDFSWYDNGSVSWNGKSYTVTDYYKDEIQMCIRDRYTPPC